jgi:hypothetical protein
VRRNNENWRCRWGSVKSGGDLIAAPMSRVIAFAVLFAIGASVIPARAIDRICTGATTDELVNVAVVSGTVGVEVRLVPVIQTMAPPTSERQASTTT